MVEGKVVIIVGSNTHGHVDKLLHIGKFYTYSTQSVLCMGLPLFQYSVPPSLHSSTGRSTHPVFHSYRVVLTFVQINTSILFIEAVSPVLLCVAGEPLYETVKSIPANSELVVYFLPERPEEVFFMPAVHYLRNSLYRRTMDTILEGRTQYRRDLLVTVLLHDTVSTAVIYNVEMLCAVRLVLKLECSDLQCPLAVLCANGLCTDCVSSCDSTSLTDRMISQ